MAAAVAPSVPRGLRGEEEEDLPGTREVELLPGDRLDPERVLVERLDVGAQPLDLRPRGGDLALETGDGAALLEALDDPHVAENEVEQGQPQKQGEGGADRLAAGRRIESELQSTLLTRRAGRPPAA